MASHAFGQAVEHLRNADLIGLENVLNAHPSLVTTRAWFGASGQDNTLQRDQDGRTLLHYAAYFGMRTSWT